MRSVRYTAVTLGLVGLTAGLAACSDDAKKSGASSSPAPSSASAAGTDIVIKTHFVDFDGTVLAGSRLGDADFCPGGTLHHEAGSPDIGHPAVNVFTCGSDQLRIGFGPGPEQANSTTQTSTWDVVGGTGAYAGASGSGQWSVTLPAAGASTGDETFTGRIVLPGQ